MRPISFAEATVGAHEVEVLQLLLESQMS